ncbi:MULTISPECIES: hypothetical protein [unclassified Streptomyces]|uniref:hypothetical protein n=1 Tax=unclassified Streptomyces TaxID=2593676 RepID=UPI000964E8B9|nr:hypothetical protein [Streptomyces sp. TSRI0281]OKI41219.1 hypothetical protein A6A29_37730 [Streptomyces sp. TSRI0281]
MAAFISHHGMPASTTWSATCGNNGRANSMRTFEIAKGGTALKASTFSLLFRAAGENSTATEFGTATGSATTAAGAR